MVVTPLCFTSRKQYDAWRSLASKSPTNGSGYCCDCTEDYQRQMIGEGRCNYPGTTFGLDEDGLVEGRRPADWREKGGFFEKKTA